MSDFDLSRVRWRELGSCWLSVAECSVDGAEHLLVLKSVGLPNDDPLIQRLHEEYPYTRKEAVLTYEIEIESMMFGSAEVSLFALTS